MKPETWDAIVVGGGPAGLSAALMLGRCRRRVLVCDDGHPRNRRAGELHGYLTRDGIPPARFGELARESLARYRNVTLLGCRVEDVYRAGRGFRVRSSSGEEFRSRKLLFATGVEDTLPQIAGIEQFYGRTVHHCPYCDGWESSEEAIAIYGRRTRAFEMARAMTAWSSDLVLCTDGASGLDRLQKRHLARNGVRLIEDRIDRISGRESQLEAIDFANGRRLPRQRLFFDLPSRPRNELPRQLGCRIRKDGSVRCTGYEATDVPGVFIAGNVAGDVQQVIVAAAEGAKAAFGINISLTREDFEQNATGRRIVEHPAA
jgi:thioredoxin reductase